MPACPSCGASNPSGARFCNACGTRLDGAALQPQAQGEPLGERRVVTMLFCDVRGSTSMAEELDPEAWTDVMNAAYEHLIAPVYRYEGTVARLMGDAILAFFGAPRAHEDDPQRAVMAGLEIVSRVAPFRERLARERGLDLNVRVGINTGSVVVGDVGSELRQEYTAMGDAVNVAARMEQTAEPGTVQITEDTYRLVGDLFDVEALGAIELKGKRRPLPAYRVLRRRASPWKVRAATVLETPLVGRASEMGILRAVIEDADRGRGSIVLISGAPGLGKSRLVEEANALWATRYPDDDRRWDFWQCVPYDAMQPYAQYRRQIRERAGIVETDPDEVVRTKITQLMRIAPPGWVERSERLARALLRVELADEPPLEGEAFQREATEVMVGSTIAQGGPRLIVFEDMHWCDHASLELVRAPTRLVGELPIVLLITFRPDRSAVSWEFKRWLETEHAKHITLIELEPLTHEQSDELIDELLPVQELSDDIRRRIFGKAEGNPLFVQEVVRALIDRGVVERAGDAWRLAGDASELTIPDTVQSLITAGLDRLPEGARRTLQAAAVIGRTFDEEVLSAVVEANGDVGSHLRELERHDLIRSIDHAPTRAYTFRHALTQEAAYGSLLVKRRRTVHRRVAETLEVANAERLEEVAPLLVRHFGEAGDDERTLRYAEMAGDAAARLYANAEAELHYRIGLDVARRLGSSSSLIRSMFERRGTTLELAGRHGDAIVNYEEMRSEARAHGDEPMELAANVRIALLYSTASSVSDPERGRALSEENVTMARRLGDRAAEGRALWNVLVSNVYGGDAARAVEAGEAAVAIARELGDREQLAFTLNDVCRAHMSNGDFAAAARRLEEARSLWEELDNRPMLGDNLTLISLMRLLQGDHAGAMSDARRACSIAEEIGNAWGLSFALMALYDTQLDLGEVGAAIDSMQRSLEVGERGGFAFAGITTRAELAKAYVYLDDADRAMPLADQALELARQNLPMAASVAQVARAHALVAVGDLQQAAAVLDEIDVEPLPEPDRTFAFVGSRFARSRLALTAGDPREAEAAAAEIVERLRSNAVRILIADALVALARALIAGGRLEDAERELGRALDAAQQLNERRPMWEALALLASLRTDEGAGGLRERARAIVEEIAAGISDEALRSSFLGRDDVGALPVTER
jgi:class 3 adenylate cyclase/tetratricopeptide (TPR) repeat protein